MFREKNTEIQQLLELQKEQLEQQRKNWNQYSAGWAKWDDLIMETMRPVGDALVDSLRITGNEKVLDVASGTGEPGLSLGSLLPGGQVTGTDLSEKMVAIANQNSQKRGIANYRSLVSDASSLPFDDRSFDHAISRFGIMFFPDIEKGLKEMTRVLKKGGQISVAVWAAPQLNPFITVMASTIMSRLNLPKPPADAPGIFRCAEPGYTRRLMHNAGLVDVSEYSLNGNAEFESPEQYWEVMSDVAGPLMKALEQQPADVVSMVRHAVMEEAGKYQLNGTVKTGWEALIVTGRVN